MATLKLSDYIARYLKEKHGVEHFFLVSGGGAMHLNDSFGKYLSYTAFHNEQSCAYAAEGYARINQRLALVNPTTGPGGLNCLSGVFGQWTDSVPVLYISGQIKKATCLSSYPEIPLRQLGDQEVDIIQSVKHLTKYAVQVRDPQEIKYHLDRAVFEATSGRFGPVWLDIPHDVQASIIDEDELQGFTPPHQETPAFDVEKIIEVLKNAKAPAIVAGHGVRLSGSVSLFNTLSEKLQIPVLTTSNGYDCIPHDNPFYFGRVGTIGQRAGNFILQNADVILFLGTRNNIRQISYNWDNYAKNAYKIVVDVDHAELDKPTLKPDMAICANLHDFLPRLLEKAGSFSSSEWLAYCSSVKNEFCFENRPDQIQSDSEIDPYHFTYKLSKYLQEDDIVAIANGSAYLCSFQNSIVKSKQRQFSNSGNAAMGFGLPAAIGAYYEAKGRNVICIEGDGSLMMNIQELQTIKHNSLPIKLFIINNNGYSSIKQTQNNFFGGHMVGSSVDSGVSCPDFVEVAKAFGLKGVQLSDPLTLEADIQTVLAEDGPVVCEVLTISDYGFMPKLSARKLDDGTMVSPSLEDMYPFLDRDEFDKWNKIAEQKK